MAVPSFVTVLCPNRSPHWHDARFLALSRGMSCRTTYSKHCNRSSLKGIHLSTPCIFFVPWALPSPFLLVALEVLTETADLKGQGD